MTGVQTCALPISFNRIKINSSALPVLNKSAKLVLYNLTFTNPRILRDGSVCPLDICSRKSYTSNGTLTFTVTGFSVYSAEETPIPSPSAGGSSGGGSGKGSGGVSVPPLKKINFDISPESYKKIVALNIIEFGRINITNLENSNETFNIKVENIKDILSFDKTNVTINPEKTKILEFRIAPPEKTGIYAGKIIVTSGGTKKEILVVINVKTEKSLFDIVLTIPQTMETINVGENLKAQINLLQAGIKEKMDVTLKYIIKDFSGKTYLTESETVAVFDQKSILKEFHTENMPSGNYVLGIELIYPNGVAVASSQFKIKKQLRIEKKEWVFIILIFVLVFIFIMVWLGIKKYKRIASHMDR